MKKTTKIIFIVLSFMTLLLAIVALTMDVGVEAAKSDIDLYHIGGFLYMIFVAVGFWIESGMWGIRKKLKLEKLRNHIIFWCVVICVAVMAFAICYGCTSDEFKEAMNNVEEVEQGSSVEDTVPEDTEIPEDTAKNQQNPEESVNETEPVSTDVPEETVTNIPESSESSSKIISDDPVIEERVSDIDGKEFFFEDAVYSVNGIEVTFHSVSFAKTPANLDGYEVVFWYTAKNTNSQKATLKFASNEGQFKCDNGTVVMTITSSNAASNKLEANASIEGGAIIENKGVEYLVISNDREYRVNGIDYGIVEIGDIMSDEYIEMDVVITGWLNEHSESMVITFKLN